jgi:hypothetical protein
VPTWGKNNLRIPVTRASLPGATYAHESLQCLDTESQDGGIARAGLLFGLNFSGLAHVRVTPLSLAVVLWGWVSAEEMLSARASVTIYSETLRLDPSHKSDSGTSGEFATG